MGFSQWWWTGMRMMTDGGFLKQYAKPVALGACSVRGAASALVRHTSMPVYMYLNAHPMGLHDDSFPGSGRGAVVVGHAMEIPFVFGVTFPDIRDTAVSWSMSGR